jgi:hypothetical protein
MNDSPHRHDMLIPEMFEKPQPEAGLPAADCSPSPVIGDGFYRATKLGTFGPSEWLDMLLAVQDGRCSCMRAKEIIEREIDARAPDPDVLSERFLQWELPSSVCSDLCVTESGYKFPRYGTCLLNVTEARQMVDYILANDKADPRP